MSKTINYELAKKLYNAGVVIESEYQWFYGNWSSQKDILGNPVLNNLGVVNTYKDSLHIAPPAPNAEEMIEFLKKDISIGYSEIFSQYVLSHKFLDRDIFRDTLFEALEATLEYLLDNGYIGNQN